MPRRSQLVPWREAGRVTDEQDSTDGVVRATGWLFNAKRGSDLTLEEFVASGDEEAELFLTTFDLTSDDDSRRSLVEIGAGIGRMTCALTRRFGVVYACDLDAGFLERCREAVTRFGQVYRLRTVPVPDGRTLEIPDDVADVVFSYLTLQHCSRSDATKLIGEALRVARPGGRIALELRSRHLGDIIVLPLGTAVRLLFGVPGLGPWLSRRRWPARMAWQINRMDPHQVLEPIAGQVGDVAIWRHPSHTSPIWGAEGARLRSLPALNRSHWWLVADKRGA